MNILHLAPLWFPISANAPGGRETFLAVLLKYLRQLGVSCAVLASGDSEVEANLIPVAPKNLVAAMKAGTAQEYHYYEQHQLCLAHELAGQFDIIHSHLSPLVAAGFGDNFLHTQHTPVWADLEWFVRRHPRLRLTAVSEQLARRLRQAGAQRCDVIYNGIEIDAYPFAPRGGEYLVFLGRLEHGKGPDLAIQAARQLGRPLKLAGPITDAAFFEAKINPMLSRDIEYVGVVNHQQKVQLLGGAAVALLPFRGQEGFGLVTIEATACGTPVVALANGALPEIVEPERTGCLACRESELPAAVTRAAALARATVRERVAARFDIRTVAGQYLALYQRIRPEARAA